jgi:hypothetical protein
MERYKKTIIEPEREVPLDLEQRSPLPDTGQRHSS